MVLGTAAALTAAGAVYALGQYRGTRRLVGMLNAWGASGMTLSELELAVRRFVRYKDSEYSHGKNLEDLWEEEQKTRAWCHPEDGAA